jgi:hypothetical protein
MLFAGTIGLLVWQAVREQAVPEAEVIEAPATLVTPARPAPAEPRAESPPSTPLSPPEGVAAFSGVLRPGVDPSLGASPAQGALDIEGPSVVRVEVDGADLGSLPVVVVLDEGRHVVRYRFGRRAIDRVYFVKPGATRTLRAITRPGGFVDAR